MHRAQKKCEQTTAPLVSRCTRRLCGQRKMRRRIIIMCTGCVVCIVWCGSRRSSQYTEQWQTGKVAVGLVHTRAAHLYAAVGGHIILFSICANNAIKYHLYQGSLSHRGAHCQWLPDCRLPIRIVSDFRCKIAIPFLVVVASGCDNRPNEKLLYFLHCIFHCLCCCR